MIVFPPNDLTSPLMTADLPTRTDPPMTTTSSSARPSIRAEPPITTIGSRAVAPSGSS
jgi:hypothetical protein